MKKLIFLITILSTLLMGGCAAPSDPNGHGLWGFTVHNRGWSDIKDPAEGVMDLSTTRDFYFVSGLGSLDGEWLGPIIGTGPSQVNAGYNLRTCLYSSGAVVSSDPRHNINMAEGFLTPMGLQNAKGKMLTAWENRMEPCMHLQGFYNNLASGVGGYCTADGQPTQKFIDKAQAFLQEHGSLSAFSPVVLGDYNLIIAKTKKFTVPWQDSTPQGFAKIACADAVMSARAGGFWNMGCQAYTQGTGTAASANSTPGEFPCDYSNWNLFAGTDTSSTFGALGSKDGRSYGEYHDWVSMGPVYRFFLSLQAPVSIPGAQASAARNYLTQVWDQVKAQHPYTGPAGQIHVNDWFATDAQTYNQARRTCESIMEQEAAYGKGKYLYVGGNYQCMLDQGWRQ